MPQYTTPAQAAADAARLAVASHIDAIPAGELRLIEDLVKDPGTDSDTLILLAEEMTGFAARAPDRPIGRALRQLATIIAEIAPTRANPLAPPSGDPPPPETP